MTDTDRDAAPAAAEGADDMDGWEGHAPRLAAEAYYELRKGWSQTSHRQAIIRDFMEGARWAALPEAGAARFEEGPHVVDFGAWLDEHLKTCEHRTHEACAAGWAVRWMQAARPAPPAAPREGGRWKACDDAWRRVSDSPRLTVDEAARAMFDAGADWAAAREAARGDGEVTP